ncbi:MAG: serine--tRNA ligase [Bacillota bacterium]
MLDLGIIRGNRDLFEAMLEKRGMSVDVDRILALDSERSSLVRSAGEMREERNRLSSQVKECSDPDQRKELVESNRALRSKILEVEGRLSEVEGALRELMLGVPNMLAEDVPFGLDESGNVEVRRWGVPREFGFTPKDHVEIGEALGIIDIERGAKIWGTRAYFLKGDAVYLEFSLVRFAMDLLTAEGFLPVVPPVIVRSDVLEGTRHYPFFRDQIYRIEGEDLALVGTSEVPLGAMHMGEILDEAVLPIRYAGFSPCYRTEVGSGGRDVRGLVRTHHFDKVEMFVFDLPSRSEETHEWMVTLEERIYQSLGIPYRVVKMCSGDLGPVAYKKYDLEFWHPSEAKYREITSCSNCTDFQARGLYTRYRPADGGKPQFVHTLNGTAIAIGRTLVALLETWQEEDGSVTIPPVLRPYMGGQERIEPRARW